MLVRARRDHHTVRLKLYGIFNSRFMVRNWSGTPQRLNRWEIDGGKEVWAFGVQTSKPYLYGKHYITGIPFLCFMILATVFDHEQGG
jgi:hypothetical protein